MWTLNRRRQDRQWRRQRREFVYLDEVSVTSLIAARDGVIAESISETLSRTSETESKSTLGIPLKGLTLGTESRLRATDASSKEVVRRAVIQSTFRDLRTGGEDEIHLLDRGRRWMRSKDFPVFSSVSELQNGRRRLERRRKMIAVSDLHRGDVFELEIRLEAHPVYGMVSAISSIMEIVEGREAIYGIDDATYEQIVPVVEMLDRLLIGLVPIRGVCVDYYVVEMEDREYLVAKSAVRPGSPLAELCRPLELVGVTEFKSYWKDLRRVLFGDAAYTTYVRVETAALMEVWSPVKLTNVLRPLSLNMDELILDLPQVFSAAAVAAIDAVDPQTNEILHAFGESLAAELGLAPEPATLREVSDRAAEGLDLGSVDSRRQAFDLVVDAVSEGSGSPPDREVVRRLREEAMRTATAHPNEEATTQISPPAQESTSRKLEVEFVAIYW